MSRALDRFATEYLDYHDISPQRRREQLNVLRALEDHARKKPEDCEAGDIQSFMASLSQHPNTVQKKLNMVKSFFSWGWQAKLVDADRLMEVRALKPPRGAGRGLPKPYSRKDLDRFWKELDARWPEVEEQYWRRWRKGSSRYKRIATHAMRIQIEAVIALALHCGLRRQEIFQASIEDIHYDNAYVVVRYAKDHKNGGKFREVPHTDFSREKVRAWLELRTELGPDHDSPWLSLAREQPEPGHLKAMRWPRFERLLNTIGKGWELHRFRHTCGTEWLRAIKRIEIVSRLLGHANVTQTLGYAELVRDDIHEAVDKAQDAFAAAVNGREP